MKLKKGKIFHPVISEIGFIKQAYLVIDQTFNIAVCQVNMRDMPKNENEIQGVPSMICYLPENKKIMVFPIPNKNYQLKIVYFPPLMVQ